MNNHLEQVDIEGDEQEILMTAYLQSMSEEQFEEWNAIFDSELVKFEKKEENERMEEEEKKEEAKL